MAHRQRQAASGLTEVKAAQAPHGRRVRWALGEDGARDGVPAGGDGPFAWAPSRARRMSQLWRPSCDGAVDRVRGSGAAGVRPGPPARAAGCGCALTAGLGRAGRRHVADPDQQPGGDMTEARLAASPPLVPIPARPQRPVVLITGCSSGIGQARGRAFRRGRLPGVRQHAPARGGGGPARAGERPRLAAGDPGAGRDQRHARSSWGCVACWRRPAGAWTCW